MLSRVPQCSLITEYEDSIQKPGPELTDHCEDFCTRVIVLGTALSYYCLNCFGVGLITLSLNREIPQFTALLTCSEYSSMQGPFLPFS